MATPKVCWVIGVGPGIGAACMRRWVKSGFKVAISSRTAEKVSGFAAEDASNIRAYPADVADPDSVAKAVADIESDLGAIHTVIYNAGRGVFGDFRKVSLEQLKSCMAINTFGLFSVAQLVAPKMEAAGEGVIAVTGASAAWRGKPMAAAFAAAKSSQRILAQARCDLPPISADLPRPPTISRWLGTAVSSLTG